MASLSSTARRRTARPRLEPLEGRALLAAAGSLDASFGSGGTVTTAFKGASNSGANALAIYPVAGTANDGKIVAVGSGGSSGSSYVELARYNPTGTLDGSFGSGGKVQTKFAGGPVHTAVLQPDGKIVVGGGVNGSFALWRYNADGTPDKTFNGTGSVTTSFAQGKSEVDSLAMEAVGGVARIVAVGDVSQDGFDDKFALARYNLNGGLDTSFGTGGKVVSNFTPGHDDPSGVAVQPDGKIVAAGRGQTAGGNQNFVFAAARYNVDGSLDATFGSGGVALTAVGAIGSYGDAVALQADGKVLVAGTGTGPDQQQQAAVVRYNPDGTLDGGFGQGGIVLASLTGANGEFFGVASQADGRVVAVGRTSLTSGPAAALARFNADGTPDAAFGAGGVVVPAFVDAAVALQADGKIVTAGGTGGNFGVARYLATATVAAMSLSPANGARPATVAAGHATPARHRHPAGPIHRAAPAPSAMHGRRAAAYAWPRQLAAVLD